VDGTGFRARPANLGGWLVAASNMRALTAWVAIRTCRRRGRIQPLARKEISGRTLRDREETCRPISMPMENRYVFEPFRRALREHDASNRWEEKFAGSKKAAMAAVMNGETGTVLSIVFDRLYVLRNQLIHGGATWNSQVNRAQVKDGAHILFFIVPALIALMIDHPDIDFGDVLYPVV